jgi:hypothetical protein
MVQGLRLRVNGYGFMVKVLWFIEQGLGFKLYGIGLRVWVSNLGLGFMLFS